MPIDELKTGRSFTCGNPDDRSNCKITPGIITIGHSLEFKVVAEGMEEPRQLHFLRAHHGDAVHGYLFINPVGAEVFSKVLFGEFRAYLED